MKAIQKLIAKNMKIHRKRRKMTQSTLAEEADNYIGLLERCEKAPSFDALGKIADALEINSRDLFLPDDKSDLLHQWEKHLLLEIEKAVMSVVRKKLDDLEKIERRSKLKNAC
ncbi:MAG: helix-turn-helix domain-containing protein [Prevotella sp.]|jgi:transcriptional regulator with XRE-family HTH domain|nr:helix-turn-helix domain-containing protein [Prevotella sp.]